MKITRTPFEGWPNPGDVGACLQYDYPTQDGPIPITTRVWSRRTFETRDGPKTFEKGQEVAVRWPDNNGNPVWCLARIMDIRKSSLSLMFNTLDEILGWDNKSGGPEATAARRALIMRQKGYHSAYPEAEHVSAPVVANAAQLVDVLKGCRAQYFRQRGQTPPGMAA